MQPFIVIGHADGQEPVAKVVIADDELMAQNELTAFIENEYGSDDVYIDGCDKAFNIVSERIKDGSLCSGALFLIVAHAEGDSLVWALVETSSLDCATELFIADTLKGLDSDIEIYIDIAVGVLDMYDNPIIASPEKNDQKVNRLEMLSVEVTADIFNGIRSEFDVYERSDNDSEFIIDLTHFTDPELHEERAAMAEKLGIEPDDIDGYICLYVES
jgi:hypothetical protein